MPSILLVTVTKVEAQAVLEAFSKASGTPWQRQPMGNKTYYDLGQIGEANVFMVQSEMGSVGPGAALLTVRNAIQDLHPTAVIVVGIAFGVNREKQSLGDILVSRQLMLYESGKLKDKFIPRGDRVTCSTTLLDKFRSGDLDWQGAKVQFGLVLSGEKLVNDRAFRKQLLKLEPEAIGGEMEGAGLYAAANDAKVDWILVKAICDFADGKKDDTAQPLAARNAAAFVLHVLQAGLPRPVVFPVDHIPPIAPLPAGSRLPYLPNPCFVGREQALLSLAQALHAGHAAAIGQSAACTGLGGIGKTQLAVEFAHHYGRYFAGGVFWLSFADPTAIPAEIAACGLAALEALGLPAGYPNFKFEDQVALVRAAWNGPAARLLIFDNCEDPAIFSRYRPTSGGCAVLVTSRCQEWGLSLNLRLLPLDVLTRAESIALLRQFRPDLPENAPDLKAIAVELGDLPLALHLAGSYLAKYSHEETPHTYLIKLRQPGLLDHPSLQGRAAITSPTEHDNHVARTFALSYDRLDTLDSTDLLAQALLLRAACFAPGEPIPRLLLKAALAVPAGEEHAAEAEHPETDEGDALRFQDACSRLGGLGLLTFDADGDPRLHRLLAAFARGLPGIETAQATVEAVVLREAGVLNNAGYPAPLLAWQNHLRHVTDAALERRDQRAAGLCNTLGYHLDMIADYAAARPYYEQALAIRKQVLGDQHPATATSLNNLGYLLDSMGDFAAARPYYEQALAIRKQVLGDLHPDTATSLNNLGYLLRAMGDTTAARPYYEQALAINREVLGDQHPATATSLNNLGYLLRAMGDTTAARPYYEQALAIRKQALGDLHPATATSLNNLGYLLDSMGDFAAARPYYEQALAILKQVLGDQHPDTAASLNDLGALLQAMGDTAAARPYYEQALAIRKQVLGDLHPDTATSLNNLGYLLQAMGDFAAARPYYEQALAINREVLGDQHPATAQSLNNLGYLLQAMGDFAAARPYFEQALAINLEVLGDQHPATAQSLNNLGYLLQAMGDFAAARPYYEQALAICKQALGDEHPTTRIVRDNLTRLEAKMSRKK